MKKYVVLVVLLTVFATPSFADWEYVERKDPMSDQDRSFLAQPSKTDSGHLTALIIKCMSDGLNVGFVFNKFLSSDRDDQYLVDARFDQRPMESSHWDQATNHQGAFVPMRSVPAFIVKMLSAETVTLRVHDANDGEMVTTKFQLAGLSAGLAKLSCFKGTQTLD